MKYLKIISYFFVISLIFFYLLNSAKAIDYQYDLGLNSNDVWLSAEQLIQGQSVRLYARIHNYGSADSSGYVTFYNGTELIGDSQVVTVIPNTTDEVWVDFNLPDHDFNILARIMGTDPPDQNSTNNETVTTMFSPQLDSDGDGIPDSQDPDNDNDGVIDSLDAYPLDPNKSQVEEVVETRNIFAPLNLNQNNQITKNKLNLLNENEEQNVSTSIIENLNTNINLSGYLNLSNNGTINQSQNNFNFFSIKNIWFDLIIVLGLLIISAIIFLIIKSKKTSDNLFKLPLSKKTLIKESSPDELDMFEVQEKVPHIKPVKKEIYKKIKVKKITSQKSKKVTINE